MRLITIIIASIFISVNVFAQGKIIVRVGSGGGGGTPKVSRITIEGQSNALGVGAFSEISLLEITDTLVAAFDRVFIFNPATGNYEKLKIGVNNQSSSFAAYVFAGTSPTAFTTFGAELGVAYRWISQNTKGLLFINKNTGDGQPISFFQKGTSYYTTALARLATANTWLTTNGYQVEDDWWLWVQGENNNGDSEASYRTALNTLISDRKADNIIKGKIVLAQIGATANPYGAGVAAAKSNYVVDNADARLITYSPYYNADNVHLNARGQMQLAYDAYAAGFSTNKVILGLKQDAAPINDPVAFWNFEEATGNFASSVGSYPLTRVNGVTTAAGKIGNAATFLQSSSQYLSGSASSLFSVTDNGFSITGWAKVNTASGIAYLVSKGLSSGTLEYAVYYDYANSKLRILSTENGSSFAAFDANVSAPQNTYFFFAFTYDKALNRMIIQVDNGTPSFLTINTPYKGAGLFYVGNDITTSGYQMNGQIDLLRVYQRKITATEITDLYNAGAGK